MNRKQLRREVAKLKAEALSRFPPRPTRSPEEILRQIREIAERGRQRRLERERLGLPPPVRHDTPETSRILAELQAIANRGKTPQVPPS